MSVANIGSSATAPPKSTANRSSAIEPTSTGSGRRSGCPPGGSRGRFALAGGGIGFAAMSAMQAVEMREQHGDQGVGGREPDDGDGDAADRRSDDRPAADAARVGRRGACSMGMTCASKAVSAGRSNPDATPLTKMTARIPSERRAGARKAARTTAQSDQQPRS